MIYRLISMLTIFLKLSLLTMFAGHLFSAKWSCLGVYRLCVLYGYADVRDRVAFVDVEDSH